MGPIVAAPIAHICVTLYRDAKTVRQKQMLLGVGIVGSTIATVGMRLWLMVHAGYPGGPNKDVKQREIILSPAEQDKIEKPTMKHMVKETFRGFG